MKALARAVYSKRKVILLDDVFSGMDSHTVDLVSGHLLRHEGIFRKLRMTVVLTTHSRKLNADSVSSYMRLRRKI